MPSSTQSGAPVLEARGITKRFPGVIANKDVDAEFHPYEIHALLGENGAGKSTLMKLMVGELRPDNGEVLPQAGLRMARLVQEVPEKTTGTVSDVVAAGLASECEVQLAYAIGVAEPVSIRVTTNGTNTIDEAKIEAGIREIFPLTPKGIIETLQLRRPIFRKTSHGGHFGRNDPDFTWEATDRAADLRRASGADGEPPEVQFIVS